MKNREDVKPISYLKEHAAELISQVYETGEPIFISENEDTKAVILDIESYDKLLEAANLNKMISFKSNVEIEEKQSDEFIEQSQFFKEFKELTSK